MKYCWTSPIMRIANSVEKCTCVLRLVLLEDVRLHGAADLRERLGPDAFVRLAIDELIPGDSSSPEP